MGREWLMQLGMRHRIEVYHYMVLEVVGSTTLLAIAVDTNQSSINAYHNLTSYIYGRFDRLFHKHRFNGTECLQFTNNHMIGCITENFPNGM